MTPELIAGLVLVGAGVAFLPPVRYRLSCFTSTPTSCDVRQAPRKTQAQQPWSEQIADEQEEGGMRAAQRGSGLSG